MLLTIVYDIILPVIFQKKCCGVQARLHFSYMTSKSSYRQPRRAIVLQPFSLPIISKISPLYEVHERLHLNNIIQIKQIDLRKKQVPLKSLSLISL